jgi:hypothetical protein
LNHHLININLTSHQTTTLIQAFFHQPNSSNSYTTSSFTMSDKQLGWLDRTSENGQTHRIKASEYDITDTPSDDEPSPSGPPFDDVNVRWEVGTDGAPSAETQEKTGITWYKFQKAPSSSPYKYSLTIAVCDTYSYTFFDSEPDYYGLNVYDRYGTHSIEFNSNSPTITNISGR